MLNAHPSVDIAYLTSRQHEDTPIGDVYPHLAHLDLRITNTDHNEVAEKSDIVFLALPHKTAQDTVAAMHGKTKIIDMSADFRLDDVATYEQYYKTPHHYADLLKDVVYGAPEFYKEQIKAADTVANPGCFALLAQLMLYPFAGVIESADIMAVTGSSGSGKSPSEGTHHPVRSHNMKSYNINLHRHIPEILRTAQIKTEQLNFVPTSGPFVRGIFASAFIRTSSTPSTSSSEIYADAPFVRVKAKIEMADIVGSNFCDLAYTKVDDNTFIAQGTLDNLVKGAAGCAVQNMNLMFGLEETLGLSLLTPVYP